MRTGLAVHHCTLYDSNWCPRSRKVFLKKAYLLLRSLFRSRMSLADQRSASGYRLLSHTVCSKQLCGRPPGGWIIWMILTATFILLTAFRGPYSAREMGVTLPSGKATVWIVGAGLILAATLWSFAALTGADAAPTHAMPLRTTWQYAVWAFLQQFMLQSFFFVRLEYLQC